MQLNMTALWDSLGWAILHSLWQGALIGLVVYGLRALATERRARLRYLSGMVGLVATFVAFIATFIAISLNRSSDSISNFLAPGGMAEAPTLSAPPGPELILSPTDVTVSLVPDFALDAGLFAALVPWLGMIWAVGFAFLGIQAFRAWSHTRFLATDGLSTPGADWTTRFARLIRQSRTHERVRLFVSEHVSGPMTLGALKPIVLVPAGFLTALPPAQVEAILLHELAHIRRHDFLFGLIQTAIRTVLYFNPAVLILSRCVDTDREQACDDIAVAINGQPTDLARGLAALRLGAHRCATPDMVMAADGGPLLARLNRLVGRPVARRTPNRLSAIAVSSLMLGTAAYSSVSVAHPHPTPPEAPTLILPDTVVRDSAQKSAKKSLYINGEKVASIVLPDMPVMPAVPAMPAMPAIPTPEVPVAPVAPVPPVIGDYASAEGFGEAMDRWGEKMESWGDKMDAWGEAYEKSFDTDYEAQWEAWSEDVEARFDDEYEDRMDAWAEEMEAWGEQVEALTEHLDGLSPEEMKALGIELDKHGEVTSTFGLSVDGDVMELVLPDTVTDEVRLEMRQQREWVMEQAKRDHEQAKRNMEQAERDRQQAARNKAQAERNKAQALRNQAQAKRDREQAVRNLAQAERNKAQELRNQGQEKRNLAQAERDRKQVERNRAYAERSRQQALRNKAMAERDRERAERDRVRKYAEARAEPKFMNVEGPTVRADQVRDTVIKALWADGLVRDGREKFRLELSDHGHLEIDGKLQTDDVAQRYRDLLSEAGVDCDAEVDLRVSGKHTSLSMETGQSKTRIDVSE